jgi:hypothetical protein
MKPFSATHALFVILSKEIPEVLSPQAALVAARFNASCSRTMRSRYWP